MTTKQKRGFAAMSPEKRREICSKGGKAAHAAGRAHEFTSEEAGAAGRKAHATGRAHEFTTEEAREAGKKGAAARAARKQAHAAE